MAASKMRRSGWVRAGFATRPARSNRACGITAHGSRRGSPNWAERKIRSVGCRGAAWGRPMPSVAEATSLELSSICGSRRRPGSIRSHGTSPCASPRSPSLSAAAPSLSATMGRSDSSPRHHPCLLSLSLGLPAVSIVLQGLTRSPPVTQPSIPTVPTANYPTGYRAGLRCRSQARPPARPFHRSLFASAQCLSQALHARSSQSAAAISCFRLRRYSLARLPPAGLQPAGWVRYGAHERGRPRPRGGRWRPKWLPTPPHRG
jgi:hypothetical protein